MIRVENIKVFNFEGAIRGMRNPLNSWDKSDTIKCYANGDCPGICKNNKCGICIGKNDLDLMHRLFVAGSEHRKYLRQIFVSMDITAPTYWWLEMDQYKIGVTTDSCSKMHTMLARPFEMNDFSFDQLPGYKNEIMQFTPEVTEEMVFTEKWKPFNNEYDISNYGRVKHNFKNHYRILGCSLHQDGYRFVTIKGKQYPLHRIVAQLFHPETYSEDLVVNHIDGNKQNNFASNLEWVTQKENIAHSIENNLQPNRKNTYRGKLSDEQRLEIKEKWANGEISMRELAKEYDVSHTTIRSILNDKYRYAKWVNVFEETARPYVDILNELRDSWLNEADEEAKKTIWYAILELLPISYNQKRTITMNYENVFNILQQRQGHKLDEWHKLCEILKDLPYVKEIMEG